MKNLLFLFITLISSCSTDETNNQTPSDFITSGKWIYESEVYAPPVDYLGNGKLISDIYPYESECNRDDVYTFLISGFIRKDNCVNKCDISKPPYEETVTWKLLNNKQIEFFDKKMDTLDIAGDKLVHIIPNASNPDGLDNVTLTITLIMKK